MNSNKLMIIEEDKLFSEERPIAEVVNNYFIDISKSLNLKDSSESKVDNTGSNIRDSLKSVLFTAGRSQAQNVQKIAPLKRPV